MHEFPRLEFPYISTRRHPSIGDRGPYRHDPSWTQSESSTYLSSLGEDSSSSSSYYTYMPAHKPGTRAPFEFAHEYFTPSGRHGALTEEHDEPSYEQSESESESEEFDSDSSSSSGSSNEYADQLREGFHSWNAK